MFTGVSEECLQLAQLACALANLIFHTFPFILYDYECYTLYINITF